MEVSINGFTENQAKHADIIWAIESQEEVQVYLNALDGIDWIDANIALNMICAEAMDSVDNLEDASELLAKY
jgi:hypothetical protein